MCQELKSYLENKEPAYKMESLFYVAIVPKFRFSFIQFLVTGSVLCICTCYAEIIIMFALPLLFSAYFVHLVVSISVSKLN